MRTENASGPARPKQRILDVAGRDDFGKIGDGRGVDPADARKVAGEWFENLPRARRQKTKTHRRRHSGAAIGGGASPQPQQDASCTTLHRVSEQYSGTVSVGAPGIAFRWGDAPKTRGLAHLNNCRSVRAYPGVPRPDRAAQGVHRIHCDPLSPESLRERFAETLPPIGDRRESAFRLGPHASPTARERLRHSRSRKRSFEFVGSKKQIHGCREWSRKRFFEEKTGAVCAPAVAPFRRTGMRAFCLKPSGKRKTERYGVVPQKPMLLHGTSLINGVARPPGASPFAAVSPLQPEALAPFFYEATEVEVHLALAAAEAARTSLEAAGSDGRAVFLEGIATELESLGAALLERAHLETGLPLERLASERNRTTGQLRMLATLLREERWRDVRAEPPLPERLPVPRPGLRRTLLPLGPVAVFGASNFPFAYSVAGGDTASAFAAGCPVVVKAHPAHPGTSELTGHAVLRALEKSGLPPGAFALLQGCSHAVGEALVRHPLLQAVGFTGSLRGGRALFDAAHSRPVPIPVFAEMGSLNPVFLLPGALRSGAGRIAAGLAQSITQGGGQFCTKPGLIFGLAGPEWDAFQTNLEAAMRAAQPFTLLHSGIRSAYQAGAARAASLPGVRILAESAQPDQPALNQGRPLLLGTDAARYLAEPPLHEENFGPSSVLVKAPDMEVLFQIASSMEGQLTATVHGTDAEAGAVASLFSILEQKAGRLIYNGFPTGVEVCPAMHHGGPYPASTDSRFTAVGTAAILRWLRPVCYQDFPRA